MSASSQLLPGNTDHCKGPYNLRDPNNYTTWLRTITQPMFFVCTFILVKPLLVRINMKRISVRISHNNNVVRSKQKQNKTTPKKIKEQTLVEEARIVQKTIERGLQQKRKRRKKIKKTGNIRDKKKKHRSWQKTMRKNGIDWTSDVESANDFEKFSID